MNRTTALVTTRATSAIAFGASFLLPAMVWAAAPAEHAAEHAAEGHGEAHDTGLVFVSDPTGGGKTALLWLFINFAALMFILNKLLFQPLRKKTAAKHDLIKAAVESATEARQAAEELISEYRGRMDRLDGEVEELMADAKKRAATDREDIIASAKAEAERIKAAATSAAERDAASRRKALENEILDRALERAEAAIRTKIGAPDQRRMVDDYVAGLQGVELHTGGKSPAAPTGAA